MRSDPGVDDAIAAVLADPRGDHSIARLAEVARMSERSFTRKFKAATATTPGRWVERVRVDTAREALENSDASPAAIAASAGFRSYETMRQAFERVVGVSPARYRSTH